MTTHPHVLPTEQLKSRFRDCGLNTLNPLVTMMMSGVFATAALAFADIMRTPDLRWLRLSIWFCLAAGSSLSISRMLSVNLLFAHPRSAQVIYQLVYAFVLSATFACLPLSTGGPEGWHYAILGPLILSVMLTFWILPSIRRWLDLAFYEGPLRPLIAARLGTHRKASFWVQLAFGPSYFALTALCWLEGGRQEPWNWILPLWLAFYGAMSATTLVLDLADFEKMTASVEALETEQPTPPMTYA